MKTGGNKIPPVLYLEHSADVSRQHTDYRMGAIFQACFPTGSSILWNGDINMIAT